MAIVARIAGDLIRLLTVITIKVFPNWRKLKNELLSICVHVPFYSAPEVYINARPWVTEINCFLFPLQVTR